MTKKKRAKGRFHPSRITGMQKQMRTRIINDLEKEKKKEKQKKIDKLDLSKNDWSGE